MTRDSFAMCAIGLWSLCLVYEIKLNGLSLATWLFWYKVTFVAAVARYVTCRVTLKLSEIAETTRALHLSALSTTGESEALAQYREERLSRTEMSGFGVPSENEECGDEYGDGTEPDAEFWCTLVAITLLYNTAHLALTPTQDALPLFFGAPAMLLGGDKMEAIPGQERGRNLHGKRYQIINHCIAAILCTVVLTNTLLWFIRFMHHASLLVDSHVFTLRLMDRLEDSWWMKLLRGKRSNTQLMRSAARYQTEEDVVHLTVSRREAKQHALRAAPGSDPEQWWTELACPSETDEEEVTEGHGEDAREGERRPEPDEENRHGPCAKTHWSEPGPIHEATQSLYGAHSAEREPLPAISKPSSSQSFFGREIVKERKKKNFNKISFDKPGRVHK